MLVNHSKMSVQTKSDDLAKHPENSNENNVGNGVVKVRSWYNKHFPTDKKTYNLRLPFVGLILSFLAADFIKTFVCKEYFRESENDLTKYAYIFAAFGVSYELYYGLKIGDRKQYTPWILFKTAEMLLIITALIMGFATSRHLNSIAPNLSYGFIVLFIDIFVTLTVWRKSIIELYGPQNGNDDDNIYETYYDGV